MSCRLFQCSVPHERHMKYSMSSLAAQSISASEARLIIPTEQFALHSLPLQLELWLSWLWKDFRMCDHVAAVYVVT